LKSLWPRRNQKQTVHTCEQFTSHLESDIYKIKPNTFKLLKHTNKDIKQTANVNSGPSKEIFAYYYKELWANNSLQEIIGMKKLMTKL
jgi:hypothetical protein